MKIITADQRKQEDRGRLLLVLGPQGIGKTSLLYTLPPQETLFCNIEHGDLAVENFLGDEVTLDTWEEIVDLACFVGGPNPEVNDSDPFNQGHYDAVVAKYAQNGITRESFNRYNYLFMDSLSEMARKCWRWCQTQPEAWSEKKANTKNTMGAYGLLGNSIIGLLDQFKKSKHQNVIFVGLMDQIANDSGRLVWTPQLQGGASKRESLGVVDEVLCMYLGNNEDGSTYRAISTKLENPWGFPSKDRSSRLDPVEAPDLLNIINKMKGKAPEANSYNRALPPTQEPTADTAAT